MSRIQQISYITWGYVQCFSRKHNMEPSASSASVVFAQLRLQRIESSHVRASETPRCKVGHLKEACPSAKSFVMQKHCTTSNKVYIWDLSVPVLSCNFKRMSYSSVHTS